MWPQNVRIPIFLVLKFKKNSGGGCPQNPLQRTAFGDLYLKSSSLFSCIQPRCWYQCNYFVPKKILANSHTSVMSLTFKFLQVSNFDLVLTYMFRPILHALIWGNFEMHMTITQHLQNFVNWFSGNFNFWAIGYYFRDVHCIRQEGFV